MKLTKNITAPMPSITPLEVQAKMQAEYDVLRRESTDATINSRCSKMLNPAFCPRQKNLMEFRLPPDVPKYRMKKRGRTYYFSQVRIDFRCDIQATVANSGFGELPHSVASEYAAKKEVGEHV